MKKKYVKPTIFIENFAISEQIAAGCVKKASKPTFELREGNSCTVEVKDPILPGNVVGFWGIDGLNGYSGPCKTDLSQQYCYNNGSEVITPIFGS